MKIDCTCGTCAMNRALVLFMGGGLLTASVVEKFASKGSDWPIVAAVLGGLAVTLLIRHLERRQRRKKTV